MNNRYPNYEDYYQQFYAKRRFRIFDKLRSDKPKVNVILFIATYISTFVTMWYPNKSIEEGAWYSTFIILILLAHEMGHYLMCKKHGIKATLPYFIPFPNPFGTMGAVIKMESRIPSRKALFDVAVAGPLAGLVITIPSLFFGIQLSEIIEMTPQVAQGTYSLGESFLYAQISKLAIGTLHEGQDVLLHPLAFAGWLGLFVTALNLLPIGQLDGGHIVYALLGKNHKFVAAIALIIFCLICIFVYWGWALLLILLIWFGYRHPPTMDESPLDSNRVAIGIITLIIFILSFTPQPFKI